MSGREGRSSGYEELVLDKSGRLLALFLSGGKRLSEYGQR